MLQVNIEQSYYHKCIRRLDLSVACVSIKLRVTIINNIIE